MRIEKTQRTTVGKTERVTAYKNQPATTRVAPYYIERAERVQPSYSRVRPLWSPVRFSFPSSPVGSRWLFVLVGVVLIVAALWLYMAFVAATHETLDQHVYRIGSQLKCPICQGESVADSSSTLAQQMRGVIREKIQEGQSDAQIIQYFSDRYGNQIVWQPQWWGFSLLTWLVPIALLLGGLVLIVFTLRDWRIPVASSATNTANNRVQREGDVAEDVTEIDEEELAHYRLQLERELASDDILFKHNDSTNVQREAH